MSWSQIAGYASDFDSGDAIAIVWCIDDVYYTAEEMGFALTQEQARDVLSLMDSKHDAEYGLCWETIRAHIDWIQYDLKDKGETLAPVVPCPECEETPLNCDCPCIFEGADARPTCSECGYKWSAMLGDDEYPTKCECQIS